MASAGVTKFYTHEIALWIRDLIYNNILTDLDMSTTDGTCMVGDLDAFDTGSYDDLFPAVFVKNVGVTNGFFESEQGYDQRYNYRILYVSSIPEDGSTQLEENRNKANRIADLITSNMPMRNPTVPTMYQAEGIWALVTSIDREPPEDAIVAAVNANFYAVAVNVEVRLRMWAR